MQGCFPGSGWNYKDGGTIAKMYFDGLAQHYGFSLDTPFKDLPKEAQEVLLYGTKGEKLQMSYTREYGSGTHYTAFEGVLNNMQRRYNETSSDWAREELEQYMSQVDCPECHGRRLKPESLAVTVGGLNIMDLCDKTVEEMLAFIDGLTLTEREQFIGARILKEIKERLGFLNSVGLGYLTLSRGAATLSGGESQRIRLATQIGSCLMGVLYVLDEPSIGLHQRDTINIGFFNNNLYE